MINCEFLIMELDDLISQKLHAVTKKSHILKLPDVNKESYKLKTSYTSICGQEYDNPIKIQNREQI